MEYQVLARKWRPQQFDEVVGQEHVTTTLKNAIARDRVAHAYLFAGPRGIGKTSVARIFAKALNCQKGPGVAPCDRCPSCTGVMAGNNMDVLEIDGASNRGIDQIRELRENVKFAPGAGRYKIYIIDEVHQITADAFNALLKTLEEPPPHVKFFFATTEPHRIPATILSRCQRFDLRGISPREIVARLAAIAKTEKIKIGEEASYAIARYAQGSLRDAVSILDQLVSFSEGAIGEEDVIRMLGLVRESLLQEMTDALLGGDCRRGLQLIAAVAAEGKELTLFLADWISYLREIMLILVLGEKEHAAEVSPEALRALAEQSRRISMEQMLFVLDVLTRADQQMKHSLSPRIQFELAFMKAAKAGEVSSLGAIAKRLGELEQRLAAGGPPPRKGASGGEPRGVPARRESAVGVKKGAAAAEGTLRSAAEDAVELRAPDDAPRPGHRETPGDDEVMGRVQAAWHEVLERVATVRPILRSYLIEGTPCRCERGVLTVEFAEDQAYHRDSLDDPREKQLVQKLLCERIGCDVGVKFEVRKRTEKEQKHERAAVPRKEILNLKKNPLIQSALEMFQAQVVEVRK